MMSGSKQGFFVWVDELNCGAPALSPITVEGQRQSAGLSCHAVFAVGEDNPASC